MMIIYPEDVNIWTCLRITNREQGVKRGEDYDTGTIEKGSGLLE